MKLTADLLHIVLSQNVRTLLSLGDVSSEIWMCTGYCSLLLKWNAVQETALTCGKSVRSALAECHPESKSTLESPYISRRFHHGTFNRTGDNRDLL